jgi:sarcosine oxidase subunit gamma
MSAAEAGTMNPNAVLRRGFHYRDLALAGARFRRIGDAAVAADYGIANEAEKAHELAIVDLSPLPRTGFKGPRIAAWLAENGVVLGERSNHAYPQAKGMLVARLAPGEVLILGPSDGDDAATTALEAAWTYRVSGVWPVPRRDASFWFVVTGHSAASMFAKICGVDLRPKSFAYHAVAQTSVARSNAIVIRDDRGSVPAYHLLGDSASTSFMWTSLIDAMAEFVGRPVGLATLLKLG